MCHQPRATSHMPPVTCHHVPPVTYHSPHATHLTAKSTASSPSAERRLIGTSKHSPSRSPRTCSGPPGTMCRLLAHAVWRRCTPLPRRRARAHSCSVHECDCGDYTATTTPRMRRLPETAVTYLGHHLRGEGSHRRYISLHTVTYHDNQLREEGGHRRYISLHTVTYLGHQLREEGGHRRIVDGGGRDDLDEILRPLKRV